MAISHIFTVTELNSAARGVLENNFTNLQVSGEISNLATPYSGHVYFSLKDANCQVRCAMFKPYASRLPFVLEDGLEVVLDAKVSLYINRGDYQLITENITVAGDGALKLAYDQLVKKLDAAGLFKSQHKQALPQIPKRIGIITSNTGAAVRDIISTLQRRAPFIPVTVYPSLVQGDTAAQALIKALNLAQIHNQCDVLIIARGGGSIEDLWAFNDEQLAYAIHECSIPVISGVGHEVDFTICDLVSDIRAATPTAAAELSTEHCMDLLNLVFKYQDKLQYLMQQKLDNLAQTVDWLQKRLRHPLDKIKQQQLLTTRLQEKLYTNILSIINNYKYKLKNVCSTLDAISPLKTLARGYSIITNTTSKKIITSSSDIKPNDKLNIRLAHGEIICEAI